MNNHIDHTQLAGQIVEKFSGIFPSMGSWDQTKANKYRDAMADALRLNDNIGSAELQVGLKTILKGEFKGDWPPAVNTFISMCKANISTAKYLNRIPAPEQTLEQKERNKVASEEAMKEIRKALKK